MAMLRLIAASPIFTPASPLKPRSFRPALCSPIKQEEQQQASSCEPCGGRGWLLCGFCEGQKTNVKSDTNRIYRRCPSCRAIGYVLCSSCKVFKCVTFPDFNDGEEFNF